jgi:hypothetical protein
MNPGKRVVLLGGDSERGREREGTSTGAGRRERVRPGGEGFPGIFFPLSRLFWLELDKVKLVGRCRSCSAPVRKGNAERDGRAGQDRGSTEWEWKWKRKACYRGRDTRWSTHFQAEETAGARVELAVMHQLACNLRASAPSQLWVGPSCPRHSTGTSRQAGTSRAEVPSLEAGAVGRYHRKRGLSCPGLSFCSALEPMTGRGAHVPAERTPRLRVPGCPFNMLKTR